MRIEIKITSEQYDLFEFDQPASLVEESFHYRYYNNLLFFRIHTTTRYSENNPTQHMREKQT